MCSWRDIWGLLGRGEISGDFWGGRGEVSGDFWGGAEYLGLLGARYLLPFFFFFEGADISGDFWGGARYLGSFVGVKYLGTFGGMGWGSGEISGNFYLEGADIFGDFEGGGGVGRYLGTLEEGGGGGVRYLGTLLEGVICLGTLWGGGGIWGLSGAWGAHLCLGRGRRYTNYDLRS